MNAIFLLKRDHEMVQSLFAEYISSEEEDFDRREDLFQEIEKELLAHGDVEEQIFYPALRRHAPEMVKQALREREEVKQLLSEMLEYEVEDDEFDNRMNVLMEKVQTHIQTEEEIGGVMEIAGRYFSVEELDEMGHRILKRRQSTDDGLAA